MEWRFLEVTVIFLNLPISFSIFFFFLLRGWRITTYNEAVRLIVLCHLLLILKIEMERS